MKIKHLLTASIAAFCSFIVFPAHTHAAPPTYTVTGLDDLGGSDIWGGAINASGQVSGVSRPAGKPITLYAVRWTGTAPTKLEAPAGTQSVGYGINDSGQVAGVFYPAGMPDLRAGMSFYHAMRWTGTTPTELGPGFAYAINVSGQVAGTNGAHAVRWTGTTAEELGTLGGTANEGLAINASGQVAGTSMIAGDSHALHATRWTGTKPTDLGTLGGTISKGVGINASGQVVGSAQLTGDSIEHAVRWTGTTATDLGTLGGKNSYGFAINASGDVLGASEIPDAKTKYGTPVIHAFLYTGGKMYDLNGLLVPGSGVTDLNIVGPQGLNVGNCINDRGQIVACGTIDGKTHVFRLDPAAKP